MTGITDGQHAGDETSMWKHRGRRILDLTMAAAKSWIDDRCADMSASLAFYAAFSLAPLLMVAIAVGSLFFGVDAVQGRLFTELESLVGRDAALAAQTVVANAWRGGEARAVGWLSLAATGVGATATFAKLNSALDLIWHAPPAKHAVAALIRVRLVSFGLVLGTGFLLVVLLMADAMILFITDVMFRSGWLRDVAVLIQHVASFGFLCMAFSVLLKVLPDVHVEWYDAFVGGIASGVLFAVGKHLFAIYLARAGTASAFGAASSLAVLMMWLFFSAAVFLFGAELTARLGEQTKSEERPWLLH